MCFFIVLFVALSAKNVFHSSLSVLVSLTNWTSGISTGVVSTTTYTSTSGSISMTYLDEGVVVIRGISLLLLELLASFSTSTMISTCIEI